MDKNNFYMSIAETVSKRSKCLSRKVGSVLVKNDKVISIGYNGVPRAYPHCVECQRISNKEGEGFNKCYAVHAEANAIIQSGNNSTEDSILYTTASPCVYCTKLIINAGIRKVYFKDDYKDINAINLRKIYNENVGIDKQLILKKLY